MPPQKETRITISKSISFLQNHLLNLIQTLCRKGFDSKQILLVNSSTSKSMRRFVSFMAGIGWCMQMYAKQNETAKFIFYFGNMNTMSTFAFMIEEKEDKGVISVRPPENSDLKERLSKYAEDTERSMNFHAVKALEEYLTKHFPAKKLQKEKK